MTGASRRRGDLLEIALVNNMPDPALAATAAQFARLVRAGAQGREIRWRCHTLPGLERSETARRYLDRSHEEIEALYRRGADAMIVTGCEPRAARLDDEPYWPALRKLVDWARIHTRSTIWSCLAAHAAVLHLAGMERRRLPQKVSGIYRFEALGPDWAIERGSVETLVPHSRYNALDREDLQREGFAVSSFSPVVGVDAFWREEPSLFVFLQGHPEYDADTLLKEYRRDVLRYLRRERGEYPAEPENCFKEQTSERLAALRASVEAGKARGAARTLGDILANENCNASWADDTARLYRNWMRFVSEGPAISRIGTPAPLALKSVQAPTAL
jgi:homoserine O-succinyltransferase